MNNRTPKAPGDRSGNRTGNPRQDRRYQAAPAAESAQEAEQWQEESSLKGEEEYLAGKHPVLEAMKAGRSLNKIFLSNQAQRHLVQPIMEEAKARGIVVQQVDKRKLDQLVPDLQHQGVVAQAAAVAYAEVDDLLALAAERGEPPLIVLLDEVEDPHNLGSVLRTADCTGVHGVIVPKRRSAGLTAVVAKTSAGAVEYVRVARVANLVQTMEKLKAAGLWIAGADAGAKDGFYETNLTGPLAIVIGNEGQGLSRLVRERCDFILSLPMVGKINSLNASVAAGVILYEVVRQRQQVQKKIGVPQASPVSDHAGDADVQT
ncbi:23S rRNA (guanosine(2251)-2'-O)-methyltransferase RlmB [Cohnella sp.]|uniref:23S rRNA (guanosine(2251)-2'-O)-methyltransferase RlmB n=1 Tax=Cohnella sp. TaxID=1883426 RepID=UPI003568FC9C